MTRAAGSLPFPDRPMGSVNDEMPFDHVIVVMMENHSLDNLFGDLGRTRADVDALDFDGGVAPRIGITVQTPAKTGPSGPVTLAAPAA